MRLARGPGRRVHVALFLRLRGCPEATLQRMRPAGGSTRLCCIVGDFWGLAGCPAMPAKPRKAGRDRGPNEHAIMTPTRLRRLRVAHDRQANHDAARPRLIIAVGAPGRRRGTRTCPGTGAAVCGGAGALHGDSAARVGSSWVAEPYPISCRPTPRCRVATSA